MHYLISILCNLICTQLFANQIVNVYAWGGEIPKQVIQQFEKETGIRVNFSTYDSNETMYAKLRVSQVSVYDVILPSSYFVERMKHKGMLTQLDHSKLNHIKNLDPRFTSNDYDPNNQYSVPLIWGATGIFYNLKHHHVPLNNWKDLWQSRFINKLLLLDDSRELFSVALLSLGYPSSDANPKHIRHAYEKLRSLIPNIKLFSTEGIQALLIDDDATAGIVWNGDAFKAHAENSGIEFVYPKSGFVIWVDCLVIPNQAKHLDEAYTFINFMLRPDVAATIGLTQGHAITNATGVSQLPTEIQNNPMIYPSNKILAHGQFQRDPGDEAIGLFNLYWQQLKMAF